jgi:hypothetical protein
MKMRCTPTANDGSGVRRSDRTFEGPLVTLYTKVEYSNILRSANKVYVQGGSNMTGTICV